MDVQAVTTYFALLALLTNVGTLALVGLTVVARRRAGVREYAAAALGPFGMWPPAIVATVATAGSLYLSEVAKFPPCILCWYQRIAMYSLAAILVLAAVRRDRGVRPYATLLAAVGLVVSAYHVVIERLPDLSTVCSTEVPCSTMWVQKFGVVTIPYMAGSAFLFVLAWLWLRPQALDAPAGPRPGDEADTHG